VAGGLLGLSAAMLVLQVSHISVGAEAVTIAFQPSWSLAATGVIVSAIVGLLAGLAPGWHAARTEIVSALRM
jgi:putative ABC transport system permease protein